MNVQQGLCKNQVRFWEPSEKTKKKSKMRNSKDIDSTRILNYQKLNYKVQKLTHLFNINMRDRSASGK